jgi:branched-subunit amino acid aminotransferase/4-amino-4-deoxychorismate lyase
MKTGLTVYLNGKYVDASEANISVYDSGFLHGLSVFEVLALDKNGEADALDDHLKRLWYGCEQIGVEPELKKADVAEILRQLCQQSKPNNYRARISISRGPDKNTGLPSQPTEMVALVPMSPWPTTYRVKSLQTNHGAVNGHPVIKSSSRSENVLITEQAQAQGYTDAIMLDRKNRVMEGPTWTVFIVRDGRVETPSLSLGILPGTVRGFILGNLEKWGFQGGESEFTIDEMIEADEAFATSSTRGIIPLIEVDNKTIGDGKTGTITAKLISLFKKSKEA